MDKSAALKAAVAVVAILIRILILVGVVGYGFYDTFKD